MIQVSSSEDL